jgi:hypothetical protein
MEACLRRLGSLVLCAAARWLKQPSAKLKSRVHPGRMEVRVCTVEACMADSWPEN